MDYLSFNERVTAREDIAVEDDECRLGGIDHTTVESRADVTSASKADEAADALMSVFESQPVQSTTAVSHAAQVETAKPAQRVSR